jgi:hypothetical protein
MTVGHIQASAQPFQLLRVNGSCFLLGLFHSLSTLKLKEPVVNLPLTNINDLYRFLRFW